MWRSASRLLVVTLLLAGASLASVYSVDCPQLGRIQVADPAQPGPMPIPPKVA